MSGVAPAALLQSYLDDAYAVSSGVQSGSLVEVTALLRGALAGPEGPALAPLVAAEVARCRAVQARCVVSRVRGRFLAGVLEGGA